MGIILTTITVVVGVYMACHIYVGYKSEKLLNENKVIHDTIAQQLVSLLNQMLKNKQNNNSN